MSQSAPQQTCDNDAYASLRKATKARRGTVRCALARRELLDVIKKYVNVDLDAVKVDLVKDGDHEVLDISVSLPEKGDGRAVPQGA